MATLYWGGGTGTWDGFTVSNWYTDFARLTLSTRAPSAEDDVIFDAASNAAAYTVTIANGTTVCRSCTIAGPATGDLTLAGSGAWYIYGNLTLPATGLTRTFTGTVQLWGVGAQTITSNGILFASSPVILAGTGTYTLQDAFRCNTLSINAGTFNTNSNNLTCANITSTAAASGTLVLGASTVSATSLSALGPLVVNAGTSTITLSSAAASIGGAVDYTGNTFYDVTFSSNATTTASVFGSNTFNNLTFTTRGTATVSNVVLYGDQTVNGTLTISGQSSVNRYFVRSNITGTTRTLTVGTVAALVDVDFRDIAVAGASAPWSGTQLGDGGGNTNITFPSPKTVYWNGTTGGTWTGNFWAASSGGSVSAANFPLAQDTAIIDNTGLNTGSSITGGVGYNLKTLTSTKTNSWTLSTSPVIYGDVTLTPSMTATAFNPTFAGRVTQNLTTAVNTISSSGSMTIAGYNASVKLMDRLFVGGIAIVSGGFDTNNQTISSWTSLTAATANTGPFSLALGSSAITFSGGTFGSSVTTTPPMTVSAGTSTITLTNGNASVGFAGQTLTWYNVTRSAASAAATFYGANTFNNLTFTAPTGTGAITLAFTDDQTINGTLALGGGTSATQRLFVQSSVIGTQRTLTAATVTGLSDIDFRDIAGAGAATWTGGTRIGDCGGNSGIGFDAPKTVYWNLAGTQNWSATGWATTPTGTPAANNFPLAQDTATFTDAGSAGTVTFITTGFNIGTIDASSRTSAMTLTGSGSQFIYGDITYGSGVISSTTSTYSFSGATTQTITTAGKSLANAITINNPNCIFLHGDAFTSTSSIIVTSGSYNTQNYNITCSGVASNVVAGTARSVTLGTSVVTLTGGVVLNFLNSAGLTFSGASSTINISGTTNKTIQGGGKTFGTVSVTGGVTTSTVTITGSSTFGTLTSTAYNYLIFTADTTQTVANFSYTGASGNVSRWYTNIPGQRATLTATSGAVGANSVDGGNNSGLTFTGSSPDYFYVKDIAYVASTGDVTVPVTGVEATGAVGTVGIPNVGVSVTGVSATGDVGTVTVAIQTGTIVPVTGVSATGQVGAVSVVGTANVSLTGVSATGAVGTVVVVEGTGVTANVTGVQATGAVGTVTVVEGQGVAAPVTGVEATGAVGTVMVVEGQGIVAPTTGVQATGYIGTVSVTGAANVFPTGVVGYGRIGTVNVWGLVDDTQTANWQNINNVQSSGWTQIPT